MRLSKVKIGIKNDGAIQIKAVDEAGFSIDLVVDDNIEEFSIDDSKLVFSLKGKKPFEIFFSDLNTNGVVLPLEDMIKFSKATDLQLRQGKEYKVFYFLRDYAAAQFAHRHMGKEINLEELKSKYLNEVIE